MEMGNLYVEDDVVDESMRGGGDNKAGGRERKHNWLHHAEERRIFGAERREGQPPL